MKKIINYFNGFSVIKWFCFICLSFLVLMAIEQQSTRIYWEYGDFHPLVVHGKIKILNKDSMVRPGDPLIWQITYDKNMPIIPKITCQLFNHVVWTVSVDQPILKPVGKNITEAYPLNIPRGADYGWWTMRRTYTYLVGPQGRKISVTAESEPFYVVASIPSRGPRGFTGETGATGKKGIQGEQGEQGKKGDKGGFSFGGGK